MSSGTQRMHAGSPAFVSDASENGHGSPLVEVQLSPTISPPRLRDDAPRTVTPATSDSSFSGVNASFDSVNHAASLLASVRTGIAPSSGYITNGASVGPSSTTSSRRRKSKARAQSSTVSNVTRAQISASLSKSMSHRRHSTSGGTPVPADESSPGAGGILLPGKPLNTHSPIAVAAAAAVTPGKIRRLLVAQGPLAIRHITSHLALTIPGFGGLSLSKQRRLIIAALDAGDSERGIQFIKVGWGRWAAVDAAGTVVTPADASSVAALKRQPRTSISANLPDSKPPLSPSLAPVESALTSESDSDDDLALDHGDDDENDDEDDDEDDGTDEEDWKALPRPMPTVPATSASYNGEQRTPSPRERDAIAALVQLGSV